MPSEEELLLLPLVGSRTVPLGEDSEWCFSHDLMCEAVLSGLLSEDPDVVVGKYVRAEYRFYVFGGDSNGGVVREQMAHSDMYRSLVTSGAIARNETGSHFTGRGEVIGNPLQYLNEYSGTILPKQPGTDATYISFWRTKSDWPVRFAKANFEGPFFSEEPPDGTRMWGLHGKGTVNSL
jgi:hypothetical protein